MSPLMAAVEPQTERVYADQVREGDVLQVLGHVWRIERLRVSPKSGREPLLEIICRSACLWVEMNAELTLTRAHGASLLRVHRRAA